MKTPLNARNLKHHLAYSSWKYILVLAAGIFLVDLLFTVTAPRIPEDKKVDFEIFGFADSEALNAYMEKVRTDQMPDMESMSCIVNYPDDTYGAMVLMTRVAAQEGDLYLLPREDFLSFAANGAFLALENEASLMSVFNEAGLDLRRGWRTLSDSDETHLFGIPADMLPGLSSLCFAENGFLTVLQAGGNTDNTLKFLEILCRDMIQPPAEEQGTAVESN